MKAMVGFMLYNEYERYMSFISDEDCGKLIKAALKFAIDGTEPSELSDSARLLFEVMRTKIVHDGEKYDKKVETLKKNGSLGGRTKKEAAEKSENTKAQAVATAEAKTEQTSSDTEADFEEFWQEYPNKTGKKEAFEAFLKINPDSDLYSRIMSGLRAQKELLRWQTEGGRYVPNPSRWLEGHRWEDDLSPPAPAATSSGMKERFESNDGVSWKSREKDDDYWEAFFQESVNRRSPRETAAGIV